MLTRQVPTSTLYRTLNINLIYNLKNLK